jgi:hypothetical protein
LTTLKLVDSIIQEKAMASENASETQGEIDTKGLKTCDNAASEDGMTVCELLENRRSTFLYLRKDQ